jgi:5,10-methylenetetrahydromethanopterin reductase
MRIAIGFNADLPVFQIMSYVHSAENLGYDGFWMHEHSFGRDAVSYVSSAARSTERIKLGFACLTPYVRHPVALAMTMATIQETSNGRATLGIGTGFPARLDLMGIKHDRPIAALKETMDICRGIWSGNPMSYSGRVFSIKNVKSLTGKPSRNIPIYIAGWKKMMLMLAGKYADGYVAKGGESTQSLRQIVASISAEASRAKRNITQIEVAAYLLTFVDKTKQEALDRARKDPFVTYMLSVQDDYLYEGTGIDPQLKKPIAENYFKGNLAQAGMNIRDEMLEAFTLVGTPDQVCERVLEYTKSGLNLPILQPISMKPADVGAVLEAGSMLIGEGVRAVSSDAGS